MTHRGPFQPLLFCDSVGLSDEIAPMYKGREQKPEEGQDGTCEPAWWPRQPFFCPSLNLMGKK